MKFIFLTILVFMPLVGLTKTISVATNQWAPYINAENSPLGTAADLLKQVLEQENQKVEWRYKNYDLGFELVVKGTQQSAFPYFKTTEREKRVLYSEAIFNVTSHLYYNRQYENQLNMSQLSQHKFGKVAGYSYGKIIDKYLNSAVTYSNEKDALEGLLKNEIDFLPMTESVMNTMLNKTYRDQALLIREVDKIAGHDSLHLIAPKTDEGLALITKVNLLISQVQGIQSLQPKPVERFKPQDIARLIAAEGYPAIVGQTSLKKQTEYYTLPRGTRVLILKWSDKIISPSNTDRIYKSMIDLSHVVVLNGPHVGKELYVKNMHLEVQ